MSPDANPPGARTGATWLLPDLDDETAAPFWAGTARGELLVQTCSRCGRTRMPPRPMCPSCRSLDHSWVATSGRGTIWSFAVPHPPLLPAYAELAPYNVVVVALEEDPTIRFVGNLLARADGAINEVDPSTITIGERVRVTFSRVDDVTLPRWIRTYTTTPPLRRSTGGVDRSGGVGAAEPESRG